MEERREKSHPLSHLPLLFPSPPTSYGSGLLSSSHMNSTAFRLSHWKQKNKRQLGLKMAVQPWTQWQQSSDWLGVSFFPIPVSPHLLG